MMRRGATAKGYPQMTQMLADILKLEGERLRRLSQKLCFDSPNAST
jgi:hypothetical protein